MSNALMGAAGVQPAGAGLPSLIRGVFSSPEAHVAAASAVFPVTELLTAALSSNVRAVASRCISGPVAIASAREQVLAELSDMSSRLVGDRAAWASVMPDGSPARELNLPLFALLARSLNYPDTSLVKDIALGMDITGAIPPTNTLKTKARAASSEVSEWAARIPAANESAVDHVMAKQGSPEAVACWNLSLKEASRGWISEPTPLTPEVMGKTPLTPRFALPERHGLSANKKFRLIDDFKVPGVNDLLAAEDTCVPQGLDTFLSMVTFSHALKHGVELLAFSEDFAHAYKNIGIPAGQAKFATIVLAPPTGPPHTAVLRTQPFGSARTPANWGRVTHFAQFVLERMFRTCVFIYVDDVFAVEPRATVASARNAFRGLTNLLGFELADKGQGPAAPIRLLGADVTLGANHVSAPLPPNRKNDLLNDIKQIRTYNQLNPSQAAKLRGRLGFSQSLLFGKVGRAMLQPLTQRQYSRLPGRSHPLSPELSDALQWWESALTNAPPRSVPHRVLKPVLVYTDACGAGHIASIVIVDGTRHDTRTHLPERFAKSGAGIFEYELAAALLGLRLVVLLAPGRPCLRCCDNNGSRGQ